MLGPVAATGRFGIAETDPAELGREVLAAWDDFLAVAASADLGRPSRLPGWSGRDTCVHLGSWDDSPVLDAIVASARAGDVEGASDPDAQNDALVQAHRDASDAQVLDALARGRDRIARFFADEAQEVGRLLSRSTVGPLPVLSLVHAGTYELAVHALDLAPCGARPPSPQLLDRGLASLIDVTGALSARAGVDIALIAMTPSGGWRYTSDTGGWTTAPVPAGPFDDVGVRGAAVDLLDASAGRAGLPQLLLSRRLHVQHLPQWMRLAPLLDDVPGLPGGAALKAGVGGLSSVLGGVGKVLGRFRR
ncbi:MAG: hypothetical protein JWM62_2923 [Frankiales bacterium]|nr:hypothetical protein [Frankiales bacterium]